MVFRLFFALTTVLAATMAAGAGQAEAPKRVVSMNACTDQMAMLIAGDGQLHSVSYLAGDPETSVLAAEAKRYVVNHGLAEEVFLMQPDLVVAGTYSTRATVGLLRRLGIPVEEFEPENSFEDIRANLDRMGRILGRTDRADQLIADLDRRLAELKGNPRPDFTVATYYANSYTSGAGTLVDAIISASGLVNLAASLGFSGTARLPLELLVLAKPDMLVDGGTRHSAPALAYENLMHPAYRMLADQTASVVVPAPYTLCGAPFTAEAARLLRAAASAVEEEPGK